MSDSPLTQRPGQQPVHRVGIHLEVGGQKRTIDVYVRHGQTLIEALQQVKEIQMVQSKGFWYITGIGDMSAGLSLNVNLPYMEYDIDPALLNGETGVGSEFWRLGKNGERIVPVATIGGKVAYLTAQDIEITQDVDFEIGWNRGRFEYDQDAHPITSPEDSKKIWIPQDVLEKIKDEPAYFRTRIEDLRSDYFIRDEILNPAKRQRMRYDVGGKANREYRLLVWQPMIVPELMLMDGLSPKLMQLAKELEARKHREKETGGQSFAPMNFGFNFTSSGFDAPQNDEGSGFDGGSMPGGFDFEDAPFSGSAGRGGNVDGKFERERPVRYAQKEISTRKMAAAHGMKTAQISSAQNHVVEKIVSAMQKIGERAQNALEGMKTATAAGEMHAAAGKTGSMHQPEHKTDMTSQKQAVLQAAVQDVRQMESMPARHMEVQTARQIEVQEVRQMEIQTVRQTDTQNIQHSVVMMPKALYVAETAADISYHGEQTPAGNKVDDIKVRPIKLPSSPVAQVVAAKPMMLKLAANESSEKKAKTGRKSAVVLVAVPVVAQKKKNATIVPAKTIAVMENKKFTKTKKAA